MAKEQNLSETFYNIYFKSLEKTKNLTEYKNNANQIDLYKKIFKNNYNIPEDKIEEFVALIHEQIELEYEHSILNFINYLNNKN